MKFAAAVIIALFGAVSAVDITALLPTGAGATASGDTASVASADKSSGVAGAGLDGVGSVLGLAGPGLAIGGAIASPTL